MKSVQIFLPDSLESFVTEQIESGKFDDISGYLQFLILQHQQGVVADELETLLVAGLEGQESEMTAADWDDIRKQARRQIEATGR